MMALQQSTLIQTGANSQGTYPASHTEINCLPNECLNIYSSSKIITLHTFLYFQKDLEIFLLKDSNLSQLECKNYLNCPTWIDLKIRTWHSNKFCAFLAWQHRAWKLKRLKMHLYICTSKHYRSIFIIIIL